MPVGPLRCLAMMNSVMSGSGALGIVVAVAVEKRDDVGFLFERS